jgi:hypothetical protein
VNLLKSPLRRTTAVLAGAFIGMAGAVALAAPASAHAPTVSANTSCLSDGTWKVDWSVGNDYHVGATVVSVDFSPEDAKLSASLKDQTIGAKPKDADSPQLTATQIVKGDVAEATINASLKWDDGFGPRPAFKKVEKPGECKPETPPTKPETPPTKPETPPATPGEPTPILEEDCTTITIGLDNPKNGEEITLHFKTSKGEERTTVIKPGEKKTEKFSATPGFTVTVSAKGLDGGSETIAYEQPEGCDNTSGGGLPVTGAAAGGIAGGAALLLVAGGGLVLMARRRKLKFTA